MRKLGYFFLLILAISCSPSEKSREVQILDLSDLIIDTLYLEKDSLTRNLGSNFTFFEKEGKEYLTTFQGHKLLTYSFPEGKLISKVPFEIEGPDGIGSYISGSFLEDSLIHFLSNGKWITATIEGKVLSRVELPEASSDRQVSNYSTFPSNPISKIGNKYLVSDLPYVLKESMLGYENWLIKFDPKTSTQEYVKFKYPDYYSGFMDDSVFGQYSQSYNTDKNEILISFPATDSILVISENSQKWISAAPKEKMNFLRGTTEERGEYIVFLPNHTSSMHALVHYDPISKKTLRHSIVIPNNKLTKEEGKSPLIKLLVLDENYQKEAEVILPDQLGGFSTPKGYYMNIGYTRTEDEVAFARIDFSKINP
ncbi:DUF4221 family protein [Algoriphagus sp. AK58]|uniref:DUF4221 family protein n=1 Tax=Algoriphagus sp. AK58 TaxID=1406877 RepID=UPI0016509122|nr:DUF4221 family protein [Algoriphagus sp. AK58]MBC6365557.1 hypothetical protein [Algoriphagus sp. AK58]